MLLAQHGLEVIKVASEKANIDQIYIREKLEENQNAIQRIKNSISTQALTLQTTNSMLSTLF